MNVFEKQADEIRTNLEVHCAENDGDMEEYFGDGSIYGETNDGGWIVGYGVYGGANIVIYPDCVYVGGFRSKPFSENLKAALADFRYILENC